MKRESTGNEANTEKAWADFFRPSARRGQESMGALCEIVEKSGQYEMSISLPPGMELDQKEICAELQGSCLTVQIRKKRC